MVDLDTIANDIEKLIERKIADLMAKEELSEIDVRSIDTLNKALEVCLKRRDKKKSPSDFETMSTEDLGAMFAE